MDNKTMAVTNNAVESDTTQGTSPVAEAPATQEQTIENQAPIESDSREVSNVPVQGDEVDPKDYQVQRLAEENRRLKEEKKQRLANESAFNAFRMPTPPVGQPVSLRVEDFTDSLTGETNWTAYNQASQAREGQLIQQAKWEAQQTTQELLDENNARSSYPELFNDPEAEQEIADRWFAAKMRGEQVSISDIAGRVSTRYQKAVSKAEKIGAERILTEVSPKEEAALQVAGQNSNARAESQDQLDTLRSQTRIGNSDAIAARMKAIPWANK